MSILTLNAGSSSLKFAIFSDSAMPVCALSGKIDRIGSPVPVFTMRDNKSDRVEQSELPESDHNGCLIFLLAYLSETYGIDRYSAVGHRVVHGLDRYRRPQVVNEEMLQALRVMIPLAPEHLPAEISLIEAMRKQFPDLMQVACFDTAFHRDMPQTARLIPIPRCYEAEGIRRYGFHGLSYEYLMEQLVSLGDRAAIQGRVILAHLGNGASLAAVRDGKSVDTSMGFTPTAGLMMGTRSGDLDPGVISFLMRDGQMTAPQFDHMINHESGLVGLSQSSSDMRDLLARESEDIAAAEAVSLFCYQAKKWIGSFAAVLGGLDTLVFSGGIGENSPAVRGRICDGLDFLGIALDEEQNMSNGALISVKDGSVGVRVINADEEMMIARSVSRVLEIGADKKGSGLMKTEPLDTEMLAKIDAYWRAANYLSVGQIYLYDNPLLKRPLKISDIKPRLLGHWGTTPGLNFVYAHLNRVIKKYDLNVINITGPGHGGPAVVANAYLEGTYSEIYPNISQDEAGMAKLFKQFSFPGGIPSHVAPQTPGSIHEGGELGYSLSHAFGAAFDNPDLLVACVVGDGEAETGPLATSWHSNKFLDPVRDGAVLPILHLNGYKIAGPTVLARIPRAELTSLLRGYGYQPYFVEGDDHRAMHQLMAAALDSSVSEIRAIQDEARANGFKERPRWPMVVLKSPKGWTGPEVVEGKLVEGTFRAHQVPISDMKKPGRVEILAEWMKSYRPDELFDKTGKLNSSLAELAPEGEHRMSANPHANGGLLLRDLRMPDFRDYAIDLPEPGGTQGEATRVQGEFIRDVLQQNLKNFRVFSPDEIASNRWGAVFEVTDRASVAEIFPDDDHVAPDGRVMEMLSEHQCEGWLEGYLLTGRHGFFSCYEAFIHIVDSMFNQHAKWIKVAKGMPWRRPIASLNYLLSSHVWRQDHNGFSHQDPGFIDHVVNKHAEIIRVYLPPAANTLLSVTDHCLRSRDYVNVVVAGKQPSPQWLNMDEAIKHSTAGIGIWPWASNDQGSEPDVVMACAGDVPTIETLAAVELLREFFPELKIRVINVVDLMKLQPQSEHPHGLGDKEFDLLFTTNKPVVFAYHGYPWLIHRLTYRRTNHENLHVRGFKEEGTTSTPLDMAVMNDLDRFHLAADVIDHLPSLGEGAAYAQQAIRDKLIEHKTYIMEHGEDMPEIRNWKWGGRDDGLERAA